MEDNKIIEFYIQNPNKLREGSFEKSYPLLFTSINTYIISDDISFREKMYLYYHKISIPICYCGNSLKLKSLTKGYLTYCSKKCLSNSKDVKESIKKTNIDKYGGHPMTDNNIKDKLKLSILIKYGVDNISKLDSIKQKKVNTCLINNGVEYPSQLDHIRQINSNNMSNLNSELIDKRNIDRHKYILNKIIPYNINLISIDSSFYTMVCDKNHEFLIHKNMLNDRMHNKNTICTKCNEIDSGSNSQDLVYDYIKDIYDGVVIKNYREFGFEIDIYLPDLKLGIEYNGLYWHCEIFRNKNYHVSKYVKCSELDISLFQIWEDDWLYNKGIIKSMIRNKLGLSTKIYARKCLIKEVSKKESDIFLDMNHLQGKCISKIKLGLYYENKLVSLMTFGSNRISLGQKKIDNSYELLRYCNSEGISVIGGASKLIKEFICKYNPIVINTYSDRSHSSGNLYKKLGFTHNGYTEPGYYYLINNKRHHRFNFRKSILASQGYDISKSEHEIMLERGINKIWDCGNDKWIIYPKLEL